MWMRDVDRGIELKKKYELLCIVVPVQPQYLKRERILHELSTNQMSSVVVQSKGGVARSPGTSVPGHRVKRKQRRVVPTACKS
jgi:hypothetical protein